MIDNRPEILVDLDGVVYSWVDAMASWLTYQGYEGADASNYQTWEVWNDWGISEGAFRYWWEKGIKEGVIYSQGPLIPGAREALWALSDAEFHIHLITNRLTKHRLNAEIISNTVGWLAEAGIPYRSMSFTHNKAVLAEYGIDDSPGNVLEMQSAGVEAYLFTSPHNVGITDLPRVDTWLEFVERLTEDA